MPTALLPLTQIAPDPDQPRGPIDPDEIQELAWSLATHGLLHPIHVTRPARPDLTGPYTILVGERRFLAARALRWPAIQAYVHEPLDPALRTMVQLDENTLRVPLSLLNRALAVARAIGQSGLSQADFARRHHKSASVISKLVWISRSKGLTRRALEENLIEGMGVAREFAGLSERYQAHLLERARRHGTTITSLAIQRVRLVESDAAPPPPKPSTSSSSLTVVLELRLDQLQSLLRRLGLAPTDDPEAGRLELLRQLA